MAQRGEASLICRFCGAPIPVVSVAGRQTVDAVAFVAAHGDCLDRGDEPPANDIVIASRNRSGKH